MPGEGEGTGKMAFRSHIVAPIEGAERRGEAPSGYSPGMPVAHAGIRDDVCPRLYALTGRSDGPPTR